MRRLVIAIVLLGLAGPAGAEGSEPGSAAGSAVHPTELMRERQIAEESGQGGRSGFWTSRMPAKGGAYRWRLLGIGLGLIALTGGGIVLLVRRANRENAARRP